ncbi:MAG: ATP-binding protein [Syntrophaceae bacterium]
MMTLHELWKNYKYLSDLESYSPHEKEFLEKFLSGEHDLKERKKREYLLRTSGIKRIKLLADFDWTFNPKIPREKIMEFMNTDWLKKPCNLVLIGPSGVGKTHVLSAMSYDAITKGKQTVFLTLFDLTSKLTKARSTYSLIDYYAKVPILCLDEVGYVMPSREHADYLFQIISKRGEVGTTVVTTNLVPSQWGKVFDSVTASAILDRLSMNGTFLTFEGRSYRNRKNSQNV